MTSQHGLPDLDASSTSPIEQLTTLSTLSSATRFSVGSNETGESSRAASQRNSGSTHDGPPNGGVIRNVDVERPVKNGRGSHRSHRKERTSGGFLLSNVTFEKPFESVGDGKAKVNAMESLLRTRRSAKEKEREKEIHGHGPKIMEKKHAIKRSVAGTNVGGSPLAGNVTDVGTADMNMNSEGVGTQDHQPPATPSTTGLDVDSARIVNLALNLSESRRNAQRRFVSTPLPPILGSGETGGSLRHHLQQQRRVSRNVSPKPDRGERIMTASPRVVAGSRINSPLQGSYGSHAEGLYEYNFTASTLARAAKAKAAIELMAQYRRLLQFVPPLKPQAEEKAASSSSTAPGSPVLGTLRGAAPTQSMGRPYNPLQYIRNRKVRARNSRSIDGEAQGFGDLEKVSAWVDAVTHHALSDEAQAGVCLSMPLFSKAAEDAASPFGSPHSSLGKSHGPPVKIKRPRIDWITSPADMIADVFWLEQDDNKKLIEDRHGRRIFPQAAELKRPMSRMGEDSKLRKIASLKEKAEGLGMQLTLDTKLPDFKSAKPESEIFSDPSTSKARRKFREARAAVRLHHVHSSSSREGRNIRGSRSRSDDSDSDDSDYAPRRRRHNDSSENIEQGKDILEKQMMEMLAREAQEARRDSRDIERRSTVTPKPAPQDMDRTSANGSGAHGRSGYSFTKRRESLPAGSSGRTSLEVPGMNGRRSMEGLSTTSPNSPSTKGQQGEWIIPASDLSSGRSRPTSPSRKPLSKMKSKIRPFIDRNHESSHPLENSMALLDSIEHDPGTPDGRRRSMSPVKKGISKTPGDGQKSTSKASSKGKGEDSGLRGLFKNARNPVSRVSDMLWKKDPSAGSGFSTDESDIEEVRNHPERINSRDSSVGATLEDLDEAAPEERKSSYMKSVPPLPVFTSPFEHRGRPTRMRSDESFHAAPNTLSRQLLTREERRKYGPHHLNDSTPRIDVQDASPTSSPENVKISKNRPTSSIPDFHSNYSNGIRSADAHLNSILGFPGRRRDALPITGLSNLETSRSSLGRQWSYSDRSNPEDRGPISRREIARVRALLLSSGIKAKEISRRAAELKDITSDPDSSYATIAEFAHEPLDSVPKSQQHRLAARVISEDVQLSSQIWQGYADEFVNSTAPLLISRISVLQRRLVDNLTPATRAAADEADEVSKDLVTSQMLGVKRIGDKIDKMMRMRRRRFRWARRGGWVVVEWLLVGVMWYVWFMVVIARVVMGVGRGIVGGVRWLFWL
ncbi:hypothetical protein MBM_09201 [Drepanopeziza brunnea f. sp. 'multigermtubi' MB_m1]|uniref:Uncharacterized protein n=1 Tax=Marssonina brunnea f. sp. multigermtubi (strain MB_m1) TaxID=1072389 RepID=K1WKB1_MARBU|nr:uncharacterized protein MBM_09201 [Drepanopeziza brunnea f. sp. 'multigermtubi' MB_m1]EKD12632.1 hypothetical protein MBM_09201 [Drepanopeziza brunnea f. sp. 'multigermtubi' MB_m1]